MTEDRHQVIESGHPLGLFKSKQEARVVITNGLLIGEYDNMRDFGKLLKKKWALPTTVVTAGGCIGPQGDLNTLLNADRLKLGTLPDDDDLTGKLHSSGLGGMMALKGKRWNH